MPSKSTLGDRERKKEYRRNSQNYPLKKKKKRMDKIENFLKEPSMERLERLRKSEIVKIGEKLEINVENSMRKLVRKIAEHMVEENVFEEAALEKLPTEIIRMTPEQIKLEKIKIQAQMELQRNKIGTGES